MGKRLYNEIHHLASEPVEGAYAFRTLVSVWLGRSEARYTTFRRIARKAGWCPRDEHEMVRNFIVDVFRGPHAPFAGLRDDESYLTTRYPRFFAATIEEEGIAYERRVVD
ncbi:hypothetical protein G647_05100 [Cladophialophora carrionii CBS 160.54]|uniref:Uncharacterized protein n=1 Tax=Cladophialophora carrionii CBS 160.54 TaxID=1279043 RepID=V9D8X6_9EURO|nr:uncharacterized protein G647_05100 [Cladophialophora carrionii CBS 160.54]ETI23300.1 hypothetical protein G647_05100 [Cladophialophora carrionii CBS 160.54]